MTHPKNHPVLTIQPDSYTLIANQLNKNVQMALSTAPAVVFETNYAICFDFPSTWKVSPVSSGWSYNYSDGLGILTSSQSVTFPYNLSLNVTCGDENETVLVYLMDENSNRLTKNAQIAFTLWQPGNYLIAYATNSPFYINSGSDELVCDNTLTSSLTFTQSSNQQYNVSLEIDFYTHDTLGNCDQISIANNDTFAISVNSIDATPDPAWQTWTIPPQTIGTGDNLNVTIQNFNQLVAGALLEVRYTVSGVQTPDYITSAFYQILGPFTIAVEFDRTSSTTIAQEASQYCLSNAGTYTVGSLDITTNNQPPLVFKVENQFGDAIEPACFGAVLLLNGTDDFDTALSSSNTLSLQVSSSGTVLTNCSLDLEQTTTQTLPPGWAAIGSNNYLCGPGANLASLDLSNSDLRSADLSGANLSGTNLSGSNLSFVDLSKANLTAFSEAGTTYQTNLTGAQLTGAILKGISSYNLSGQPASLPANWQLVNACLIGPGANLANQSIQPGANEGSVTINFSDCQMNADLTGANFAGGIRVYTNDDGDRENVSYSISLDQAILSEADLSYVSSGGIAGTPASLPTNWQLVNGYLVGPNANLSNADLSGQDLSASNLANANLSGSNLENTNFGDATILDYVISGQISGTPASLPGSWLLVNGYLIGPKANLINADLSNQDLSTADFSNGQLISVNLSGTNLSNATLNGILSGNIQAGSAPTLPEGWTLSNGCLVES